MEANFIKSNPIFDDVPESQIEWMLTEGEFIDYQPGDFLFQKGEIPDFLHIVVKGEFIVYFLQAGERRMFGEITSGEITGILPYSRMNDTAGYGEAKVKSSVFTLHKKHFPTMIHDHYELTSAFVHQMTNRVRSFTSLQLQDEKLMALGKLSAGLAHELNNPASAIVRSAQALQEHLRLIPEGFKQVIKIRASDQEIDAVNNLLFQKIDNAGNLQISLMEKTEKEDDIADWLEEHGVEDGYEIASNLIEYSMGEEDLDFVLDQVGEDDFPAVIQWIESNLNTEKMVDEIEEAASRIAELVQSVKGYTHMDQAKVEQEVDLHVGLNSTLTMLKHKIRQNQVEVIQEYAKDLNSIRGFPGELNQVFTNLIDNALDAMESKGGQLRIKTWNDNKFVRLNIQDTGTGISEEHLRRIFDPFYSTKEMGKGTGMGLDVVKKIMNKHKAVINVQSEPGNTVFELCFSVSV